MTREGKESEEGKEFAQIVVPERSAHLYKPEWHAVCTGNGITTLRKRIKPIKEGDN